MFFLVFYKNIDPGQLLISSIVDTYIGDVLRHAVVCEFGPCTLGFVWVNLERDGRNNKHHLGWTESRQLLFVLPQLCKQTSGHIFTGLNQQLDGKYQGPGVGAVFFCTLVKEALKQDYSDLSAPPSEQFSEYTGRPPAVVSVTQFVRNPDPEAGT